MGDFYTLGLKFISNSIIPIHLKKVLLTGNDTIFCIFRFLFFIFLFIYNQKEGLVQVSITRPGDIHMWFRSQFS